MNQAVAVRIFIIYSIVLLVCLRSSAQTQSSEKDNTKKVHYGFVFDQDMFLEFFHLAKKNEDRNYTMGGALFASNNRWADRKFFYPLKIAGNLFTRFSRSEQPDANATISVGVTAFTPRYLEDNEADSLYYMVNDRPFASLTFLSFKRQAASQYRVETNQFVFAALGLGIAREVQTYIHKNHWFGSTRPIPTGWKNQVSNGFEPTFLFSNKADILLNPSSLNHADCISSQFILSREYRVGYYTGANAAIAMRFGKLDPRRWASYDMYQLNYASQALPEKQKLKWQLYTQFLARPNIVLYNAALNGQFRHSFHTFSFSEIQHVVVEGFGGLGATVVNCKRNFSVDLMAYISGRTPEFKTSLSNRSHLWGGVQLLFTHLKN